MDTRMLRRQVLTLLLVPLLAAPVMAQDDQSKSFTEAMTSGEAHVGLRYRYEFVDQDFNVVTDASFEEDAHASTLRLRLNYRTGKWRDWSAFGEFDYVGELLMKDFNNTVDSGRGQYPVVADPKGADLNQLYLDYDGFRDTNLRFGRRRIVLDNQRFVGGVAWRQNEQTFDSISGTFDGFDNIELFYSYVGRVNRVFGERSPVGKDDNSTHLLNANIGLGKNWRVIPYYYYIDSEDTPAFSSATLGARATGNVPLGKGKLALVGELATQSDAANAPTAYTAQYYHLDANWALGNGLSLGLGLESLGGDEDESGKAFRTPLATLHLFQGWADQFLATPGAGVDDLYLKAGYKTGKWTFTGVYHDFSAQSGSASWGSELDASAARSLGDRYSVLFKGAWFRTDNDSFSDVTKFWIMLTAKY